MLETEAELYQGLNENYPRELLELHTLCEENYFGAIPAWAYLKMVAWGILALTVLPIKKKPEWAPALWVLMPVVGSFAVWLAVSQPFG